MAKPTTLLKKVKEEICGYVENGNTFKDAFTLAGVGESTFYDWKKRGKEDIAEGKVSIYADFHQSLEKSLSMFKAWHIQNIMKAAKEDKQWTASAWLLERKFREEFGRTLDVKGKFDVLNFDIELSPEDEKAYEQRLKDIYDL